MAQYDPDQTLIAAGGNVFVAPVGSSVPTGLEDPAQPWVNLGYVSEDGVTLNPEKESEEFNAWQQKSIRVKSSGQTFQVSFALLQIIPDNLKLVFGGGTSEDQAGIVTYTPPDSSDEYEVSVIVDAQDGSRRYRVMLPRATSVELGEVTFNADSLAELPVTLQAQSPTGGGAAWSVRLPTMVAATGATAGSPGSFTPSGSTAPTNLTGLQSASPAVVASPLTAWTTGQHIILGDASHAHWDGDSYETGDAP